MDDVTEVRMGPMPESPYVKPIRLTYTQGGKKKSWDLLEVHNSVAVVLFNVTRRTLVFVKQFRPAVYFNNLSPEDRLRDTVDVTKYPPSLGITLELCAGIVDKNISLTDIACEEVHEECGYHVKPEQMQRIISYRSGVGVEGALQTLFYCEVSDDLKVGAGGGVDEEMIDVVELSIAEVEALLRGPGPLPTPPSALFGLSWFMSNKAPQWRK